MRPQSHLHAPWYECKTCCAWQKRSLRPAASRAPAQELSDAALYVLLLPRRVALPIIVRRQAVVTNQRPWTAECPCGHDWNIFNAQGVLFTVVKGSRRIIHSRSTLTGKSCRHRVLQASSRLSIQFNYCTL